jgi:hypothetical protein
MATNGLAMDGNSVYARQIMEMSGMNAPGAQQSFRDAMTKEYGYMPELDANGIAIPGQRPTDAAFNATYGQPGQAPTTPGNFSMVGGGTGGAMGSAAGVAGPVNMGGGQQPQIPGAMGYAGADGPGGFGGAGGGQGGWMAGGNPYLPQMADEIGRRNNLEYGQKVSQIRSNAVGVGGLGGSRQGVAEGQALGASQDALQGNLASLFSGQYNADANRGLQQYGMDQNYDLGSQGLRNNFYTAQRGQDLTAVGMGADIYGKGMDGPWNAVKNANSVYAPYGSQNGGGGQNDSGGNWQQILAGLGGGAKFGRDLGWW